MTDKSENELKVTSFEIIVQIQERMDKICKERDMLKKVFINKAIENLCQEYEDCPVSVYNHTTTKIEELNDKVNDIIREMRDKDLLHAKIETENKKLREINKKLAKELNI